MDSLLQTLRLSPVSSVLFVGTLVLSIWAFQRPQLQEKLWLRPFDFVRGRRVYTVLSSGLIHADWWHLAVNLFALALFAFKLEHHFVYSQVVMMVPEDRPDLQVPAELLGHGKFLLLYVLCLVLGDGVTILKYRNDEDYACLGASGAISGLVMATLLMSGALRLDLPLFRFVPVWVFALAFLVYSYITARLQKGRVAHESHLGGALVGGLLCWLFYPEEVALFVNSLLGLVNPG